jgi:hypothetical protein
MLKSLPGLSAPVESVGISDPERLANFYGKDRHIHIRYVREKKRVDYGQAHDDEYFYDLFGGET